MSTSYICKKCNYNCSLYVDMKRHITKKYKCKKKNLESFKLSDDQIFILTIIPYHNNVHDINLSDLDFLRNSNKIWNNMEELINILEKYEKQKLRNCEYCNKSYDKISDLKKHMLLSCFLDNVLKNKEEINNSLISVGDNNNILNNCNLNTTNNITQNIFLDMRPIIPFDEDWDLSLLDNNIKARLLISKIMYTTLLEEILKNDKNLNIIIDNDSKSGVVYKNEKEQYIDMKIKDIMDESMDKLKKHLLNINENCSNIEFDSDILRYGKNIILTKHNQYVENENIHDNVNNLLSTIFGKKKDLAIDRSKLVENSNLKLNGF